MKRIVINQIQGILFSDDDKRRITEKIDELGIIAIEDANSQQAIEDDIKAIEEVNKSPWMIAAPLVVDGNTDRKLFNTRKKILVYFAEKNITSVSMQREILQEAMGSNQTFYTGANTEEQKLECDIAMYLSYQWVYGRRMQALLHGKKNIKLFGN